MAEKKQKNNLIDDEFGFHPKYWLGSREWKNKDQHNEELKIKDWLLNKWEIIKWIFFFIVIIGMASDLFGNHLFDSSSSFFSYRWAIAIIAILLFMLLMGIEYIWFKKREKNPCSKKELTYSNGEWKNVIEIYRHTDNLYHHRFDFFLVAESMLIVSFVTTLSMILVNKEYASYIQVAIALLGMVYTFSWFYVNKKLDWRLTFITHKYLKGNLEFNDYLGSMDKISRIHNGFFLSNILPTFTFVFWYFLFYIAYWKLI